MIKISKFETRSLGLKARKSSGQNSNLHYTRKITPNQETTGGAHLRGLAPGQRSSEETSQRWRAVGDIESNLTGQRIEPHTSRTDSDAFKTEPKSQ